MAIVNNTNKRIEERTPLAASIFYSPAFEAYKDVKFWGITLNTSPSGLCLYTNHLFEKVFHIKVYSNALWNVPIDAEVIWCKEISENLYRTGLSLL